MPKPANTVPAPSAATLVFVVEDGAAVDFDLRCRSQKTNGPVVAQVTGTEEAH